MNKPFKQDWRYAQANREALLTLGAYGLYFVWWYACAYGLGDGDPEGYTYIFGLPAWFFLSCIAKLEARKADVRRRMLAAGAHYVVDTIAELPAVIAEINRKLEIL